MVKKFGCPENFLEVLFRIRRKVESRLRDWRNENEEGAVIGRNKPLNDVMTHPALTRRLTRLKESKIT